MFIVAENTTSVNINIYNQLYTCPLPLASAHTLYSVVHSFEIISISYAMYQKTHVLSQREVKPRWIDFA